MLQSCAGNRIVKGSRRCEDVRRASKFGAPRKGSGEVGSEATDGIKISMFLRLRAQGSRCIYVSASGFKV